MEFPNPIQKKAQLVEELSREEGIAADKIYVIASPYRICPLGAHIDHQGGPVLGMTINAYTLMAFTGADESTARFRSKNYPGTVTFEIDRVPESTGSFWGVYARAAALALKSEYPLKRGVTGLLDGMLPGCGLSSSASVLLAYLHAFAMVNDIELQPWDYVRLNRIAENRYIGLNNGILDQTSIVFGKRDVLLYIDTKAETVTEVPDLLGESRYRILVAYSGYSRELTTSGYNTRVDECRQAAARLSSLSAAEPAEVLSDVPEDVFIEFRDNLAPDVGRRANHYFSEVRRVKSGLEAWENGSIDDFGGLMTASCNSSIEQYECGIQAIYDLQQIVSSANGVFGSRFMGGGFGGCVVGFVQPDVAENAADDILEAYRRLHPEVAGQAAVYLAKSAEGVGFI